MSGHTATPWAVDPDHRPGMGWNAHVVEAADPDNRVCFMTSGPEGKINAAFIVTACNSHAELVKALEKILQLSKPGQTVSLTQAIDILTDIWNESGAALAKATPSRNQVERSA